MNQVQKEKTGFKLFHGDNGVQEYFETKKGSKKRLLLLRVHGLKRKFKAVNLWTSQLNDKVLEDLSKPEESGTFYILSGKTAEILAKKIEKQEKIKIVFGTIHKKLVGVDL